MDLETIKEKSLFQLTVEEYLFLQGNVVGSNQNNEEELAIPQKKYVYGIRGIASLLGCSIASANRLKKEGIINDAIIQNGRKIITDADMALELMKKHQLNK